jgi:hypothetical protein
MEMKPGLVIKIQAFKKDIHELSLASANSSVNV